jgi:hypothetical protein
MNVLHLCSILLLQRLHRVTPAVITSDPHDDNEEVTPLRRKPTDDLQDQDVASVLSDESPLLQSASRTHQRVVSHNRIRSGLSNEEVRGRFFVKVYGGFVILTWMLFLVTAWTKLKMKPST